MNNPAFQMMMHADEMQIQIVDLQGRPYFITTLEFTHTLAQFSEDGKTVVPFYYYKTIFDDDGHAIGTEEKPTICLLQVVEYDTADEGIFALPIGGSDRPLASEEK